MGCFGFKASLLCAMAKFIRWGLVIHGCIDGYSQRIMFLSCNNNNLATTVLNLFESAVAHDGGLWPSRIRVDYGVENVAVCDAMVAIRGAGRGSFIAGSSHRNQRVERLWRNVFRCICHLFYYTFYALEQSGMLSIENPVELFCLHYVFLPRINEALKEWMRCHNDHPLATEHNWSPNQIWLNGMMNACNPLARGEADHDPDNITVYGDDPEFSPFEELENDVQVFPPNVPAINSHLLTHLQTNINPLQDSTSLGIDIYMRALEIVVEVLQNEAI